MGRIRPRDLSHPLSAAIRDNRHAARRLASASKFSRSGLSVTDEGEVTVTGNLIVTGDFTAQGKVSNEALENPVRGDVTRGYETNFALSTSLTLLAEQTWAVPDGFNQVAVSVVGKVFAYNNTAGLDYLYALARVIRVSDDGTIDGVATPVAVSGSNGSGTSLSLGVAVVPFSGSDSLKVQVLGKSEFGAWSANANNVAEVAGSLTWYRT